jgi:hypothetical protein
MAVGSSRKAAYLTGQAEEITLKALIKGALPHRRAKSLLWRRSIPE